VGSGTPSSTKAKRRIAAGPSMCAPCRGAYTKKVRVNFSPRSTGAASWRLVGSAWPSAVKPSHKVRRPATERTWTGWGSASGKRVSPPASDGLEREHRRGVEGEAAEEVAVLMGRVALAGGVAAQAAHHPRLGGGAQGGEHPGLDPRERRTRREIGPGAVVGGLQGLLGEGPGERRRLGLVAERVIDVEARRGADPAQHVQITLGTRGPAAPSPSASPLDVALP
jgi:hypothetical protein